MALPTFRAFEDTVTIVGESDDKDEIVELARERHRLYPDRWHEAHQWYKAEDLGMGCDCYVGFAQWKPGDCPDCQAPKERCNCK